MNRTALLAAVGVAVLGFVLLALYIRRFQTEATGGEPVELLMVVQDVALGATLTDEMLGKRSQPEHYVEDRDVRSADLDRVLGVRAGLGLKANQTLQWTDLETTERETISLADRIRKGMRAITIETEPESSHSGLLRPGNRVDVMMTSHAKERVTAPLLQNLLVIAVGSSVKSAFDQLSDNTEAVNSKLSVTLAVTLDQAALLAHAEGQGAIRLIVRNDDDLEVLEEVPDTTDRDITEASRRALRQHARSSRLEKVQ